MNAKMIVITYFRGCLVLSQTWIEYLWYLVPILRHVQGDELKVPGSIHISVSDHGTIFTFEHGMQRATRKLVIISLLADVFQGQHLVLGAHLGRAELRDLDEH